MSPRTTLFDVSRPRKKRETTELSLIEQIHEAGLPEPEPEFPFGQAIGRKWRFDLAWPTYRLALEIEGAVFGGRVVRVDAGIEYRTIRGAKVHVPIRPGTILRLGGRHNTGAGQLGDLEKYNTAAMWGWTVLRATTTDVRDQRVIPLLVRAFEQRGVKVVAAPREMVPW